MKTRSMAVKVVALIAVALPAAGIAAPSASASAVPERVSGAVMTAEEAAILGCTKGGFGESIGWARCTGTHKFKVRVWCTWAGSGLSDAWRTPYNWAQCNRGSVHDESNGIEVIWA